MKVSLNQIEHLARKATRGAGRAWGLAFDAGRALRWLHAYGLNGAPALAAHLDSRAGDPAMRAPVKLSGVWRAADGALDPLATGASMSDCLDAMPDIETAAIAYPLLAAGFVGCAAESEDAAFELTWRGCVLRCARGRVRVSGATVNVDTGAAECMRCRPCEDDFRGRAPRIGATVDAGAWAILERHARRTHVAATSASRLTGAGAGLSDND